MAEIIDGKAISAKVRKEVAAEVESLQSCGITPGLAVVLVGNNSASEIYVRSKEKACAEVGIRSVVHRLPVETTQAELLALIGRLNQDPAIHGILVQLPVPSQIDARAVQEAVSPDKDVDGFHPVNIGRLWANRAVHIPCTPLGIMRLLDESQVELAGKRAVVVGRSDIVGKPMAALLLHRNATVTICHSHTADLAKECREADILVVAVGRPGLVKGEWLKPGSTVIDVGINRLPTGLVGDVDFASASTVAGKITPVPGGVGPMTIAMLLSNTVQAAKRLSGLEVG